jgi:predicted transcriptional regulator
VKALILLHGYASLEEIAFILDDNPQTISYRAQSMVDKGYLATNDTKMYSVTKEGHAYLDLITGERSIMYGKTNKHKWKR